MSHPVWVRGLKLCRFIVIWRSPGRVAPRVGAWIETLYFTGLQPGRYHVAPRVGAWIETKAPLPISTRRIVAPRVGAWIETISAASMISSLRGRTPCGCVD